MTSSARWTIAAVTAIAALVVAMVLSLGDEPETGVSGMPTATGTRSSVDPEQLAQLRRDADLPPCPVGDGGAGPAALQGVSALCAADGGSVDVARALAGRPTVLNLWAYWCGPCADELPALVEYQQRVGPEVQVLTVHQDPNQEAALARLSEWGVRLPTLQDGDRSIAAALKVPNVMPATVLIRADGTVAEILPRPFVSADEIAAAVGDKLR
ncbi:MAG: TlpA disulfide reductase family protein [Mycobacterium sp.]